MTSLLLIAATAAAFYYGVASQVPDPPPGVSPALARTVAQVLAAVLAGAALLAVRRLLYDRLARRPGPLEITSFTGDPESTGVRTEDVLADFRRAMTDMSLSAPEPVPNEPATDGVLDDVRTAFDGQRGPVTAAVLLLVSLVRIRYAYRVSVQMLGRRADGRCGISVHVSRLPSGSGEVETIWAPDWSGAARRACHVVGAYVVPRSRLSLRPPWRAWRGLAMPHELFHLGQEAAEHVRSRRYDEALSTLHEALKHDPQNPYLRIQLGQVQEQLGLLLDATATYADIVAIEAWHDRRLWRRLRDLLSDDTTGAPPPLLRRNPNGRDALLIARYRVVSRLAAAEQLVDQWSPGRGVRNPRRESELYALRSRLRIWMRSYVRGYQDGDRLREIAIARSTDELAVLEEGPRATFRHFVQYVALRETDSLIDDYRWSRGRRLPGMSVSQTGLNLLRLWSRLYMKLATHELGLRRVDGWPPDPVRLDLQIARYLALKPVRTRGWKEYYNAACTVAVALHGERRERPRKTLALQAVRHLERAVSCTDSGYVGRYAQWLSTGDPDLNPLRETAEFVDFLDRYLPNPEPRIPRPGDRLLVLVMSHYTLRLLQSFAERRTVHLRRGRTLGISPESGDDEATAFEAVSVYVDNERHWQTRADLIACAAAGDDLPALRTDLPRFQDDPEVREFARLFGSELSARDPVEQFGRVIERRDGAWHGIAELVRRRREQIDGASYAARTTGAGQFWSDVADAAADAIDSGRPPSRRHVSGETSATPSARTRSRRT